MRAAVYGPGALGCLFAARLARAGVTTVLVDHRRDRADRLNRQGIIIEDENGAFTQPVPLAVGDPGRVDLCIICVKAYSTATLALPASCPVLTLQNGLGNAEKLCATAGASRVLAGSTSEAATLLAEGRVRHFAAGQTTFGAWTSCPTEGAAQALRAAGFAVELTDAPGQAIWEKAAVNAGINPLTALLDVPNGRLIEIPEARQLMRDLVVEAVKVATSEGYRFPYSLVEKTEEICRKTAGNTSSMLQDVRNGKPTEIDAISGEILARAEVAALPTPRTRVVWQLVKGRTCR